MHLPLCPAFMVPLCCEAQAEMQTEAVKVEVLQSGEAPCTAGGTYMYLHLPSKNRVSIRFQATGWSVRNVHMLEISFWYWIAIPFGLWLVSPLALFTIKRNFPFAHHGGCEDDCRFLLASILPDEGLDWPSMILCNSATLWFFTFGMPHFPFAALRGCGSREKFDLRGHEFYFLIFLVIYRLVVREWEVVGSGKLYSQTESSSSIYCSLLQFLADCFPWRMRRRLSIPTGINIARWRTGLAKHDSVQLCNSLIFDFWDATFSSCCTQRMRKSRKIRSARTWVLFSNFFGHLSIGGERMRGGW